ncbi:HPr family phosphocarrier protein [Clostridium sp.]|jgi:phosphocarrier protein HPr|uniref:HPr family phosphocarrier protein n=1 Tax=Clostridium sp. TaxID=1506 RepID=UPI0025C7283F|nr:HPr family phosphocarrier protein [Clostridium sp.]
MTAKIKLALAEDIKKFVNEARTFTSDINVRSGNYVVDGKSILGLFSINTSNPIEIELVSSDLEEIEKFNVMISKFKEI